MLKLSQLWLLGILSVSSCIWDTLIILCMISTFLLSGAMRWSRLILYISCSSPSISHFSKHPWFLLLKHDIKNQDLGIKCACCYWNVISSWQSKKKTCVSNLCIYKYLHIFLHLSTCNYIKLNESILMFLTLTAITLQTTVAYSPCLSAMFHSNNEKVGSHHLSSIYIIVQFLYIYIVVSKLLMFISMGNNLINNSTVLTCCFFCL